jgi:hypothetical protein
MMPKSTRIFSPFTAVLLVACAGGPVPFDWQVNVQASTERAVVAYMTGRTRVEQAEFAKSRAEVARTGKTDLIARVELVRCATRVASLVLEDCPVFAALSQDAGPAERAYADYLSGRAQAKDILLLPPQHRAVVMGGAQALLAIKDPLSRLVAAGVLFKMSLGDPAVMALAVDTASEQGWSRPLLAWLHLQAQRAELSGDMEESARLRRRIGLVLQTSSNSL